MHTIVNNTRRSERSDVQDTWVDVLSKTIFVFRVVSIYVYEVRGYKINGRILDIFESETSIYSILSLCHNIEHFSVGPFVRPFTVIVMKIVRMLENHNSSTWCPLPSPPLLLPSPSPPTINTTFCQNAR